MAYVDLSAADANATLARYRVIDVRAEYEFHGPLGRLESAELVPLETIADEAERLATGQPLLLVCRSGRRSGKACELLQERGLADVSNLAGGMIGWNRAGLAVRRSEPGSLAALIEEVASYVAQVGPLSQQEALAVAREHCAAANASLAAPNVAAVETFIAFAAESLTGLELPDLDLSLAAFRRALAAL